MIFHSLILAFVGFGRAPLRQQAASLDAAPGRGRAPGQAVAAPERPPALRVQVEPAGTAAGDVEEVPGRRQGRLLRRRQLSQGGAVEDEEGGRSVQRAHPRDEEDGESHRVSTYELRTRSNLGIYALHH